ncbi:hypothetical protein [Pseudomonas sp. UMAB-40]|uniref:hypothetical protein n=1 Tax=Pseudomonas sp. UMAB-40 TaxID=1365407 RepID=UPI001C58309B|nr:hypothetical protein [Pseudomonas sp. UMAB-40]
MSDEIKLHPREIIAADLEKYKEQFFAAGKTIQDIPPGHSGVHSVRHAAGHHKTQQVARTKLARALREHAEAGRTLKEAARTMRMKIDKARVIAREDGIVFNVE